MFDFFDIQTFSPIPLKRQMDHFKVFFFLKRDPPSAPLQIIERLLSNDENSVIFSSYFSLGITYRNHEQWPYSDL